MAKLTEIVHNDILYIPIDGLELIQKYDDTKDGVILISTKEVIFFNKWYKTYTKEELESMNVKDFMIIPDAIERKVITDTIWQDTRSRNNKPYQFKDFKQYIQDDDYIQTGYNEGWQESDSAMDGHYYIEIQRERLQTDDEYEASKQQKIEFKERNRKQRYENYLKLKEEFEPAPKPSKYNGGESDKV